MLLNIKVKLDSLITKFLMMCKVGEHLHAHYPKILCIRI